MRALLVAAAPVAHTSVQWGTLAWIAGAAIAAALTITVIFVVSRRPKSMEDGMEEFSRSLKAVAPAHRLAQPAAGVQPRAVSASVSDSRPARATRGETEAV